MRKILWSIAAGLTTPEAVQAETKLAAIVLTRLALYVPAIAIYVDLLVKALK